MVELLPAANLSWYIYGDVITMIDEVIEERMVNMHIDGSHLVELFSK